MDTKHLNSIVEIYESKIPELKKEDIININNINDKIDAIYNALKKCEKQIEEEHKKTYVTDNYENDLRSFTNKLVSCIFQEEMYEELKDNSNYKKLFCQRHVAYSFYHYINNEVFNDIAIGDVYSDEICKKNLYNGLAEFYSKYFGSFYDNEEAIELLCKYFPEDINRYSTDEINIICYALYKHISMAGTPNDLGYAYGGIDLIIKYIGRLPDNIVKGVLILYPIDRITLMGVYRHQIVSIIMYSCMNDVEKIKIKFWCVDAVMIIEYLNRKIIQIIKENSAQIEYGYSGIETTIATDIEVLKTPKTYWENTKWEEWTLYIDNEVKAELSIDNIEFYGKSYNQIYQCILNDWQLNADYNKIFFNDINEQQDNKVIGFNKEQINKKIDNNKKDQITFSLLFLNNYRGLKSKVICFDHKYEYDEIDKKIIKKTNNCNIHFYGKNVYSLTCLVGKNGTGKTSIVDFLRETFFGMLHLIKKNGGLENGYISKGKYEEYDILDEGAEFIVVFHLNEKSYYITNMSDICAEKVDALTEDVVFNINNIGKVGYFSNMLRADWTQLYDYDRYKENNKKDSILKEINQKDFSETKSFIIKNNQINNIKKQKEKNDVESVDINIGLNIDLFYQLFFLYNVEEDRLKRMFGYTESKQFYIDNVEKKDLELYQIRKNNVLNKIIDNNKNNPLAILRNFSSGEYFKFMLFSKLYFF